MGFEKELSNPEIIIYSLIIICYISLSIATYIQEKKDSKEVDLNDR